MAAAVIDSLSEAVTLKGWNSADAFQPYDILIVNGEGSMHHNFPDFHKKISVLNKAIQNKIPCFLLNSVWQENSDIYDDIVKNINGITVREILSKNELLNKHNINSEMIIDASYFAKIDSKAEYVDLNNKPVTTDFYYPQKNTWDKPPENLSQFQTIDMASLSWSSFVLSLKTASLLVTGRHHAVYAACKARIPFIASESNTHKISGLIKSAKVNIPIAKTPEETYSLTQTVHTYHEEYQKLFKWMDQFQITDLIPFDIP